MKPAVSKPGAGAEPVPNPDVMKGDHVFFKHPKGPHAAEVLATGRHGITVKHQDKPHKVKWEHVLGHHTRAPQTYDVLDEGEDGVLVKDASGARKYLNVPPEARGEKMVLEKSFHSGAGRGRLVIFSKAGQIANRPGLSLQQSTDRNGRASKHWVRTNKELPKAREHAAPDEAAGGRGPHNLKPGDQVSFQNGEHAGKGKVHAVGEHGAIIHDISGGEHRVRHEHINPPKPAAAQDGLFDPAEIKALPAKVDQPVKSWDELLTKGTEGLGQLTEALGKVGQSMGLKSGLKPKALTDDQWHNDEGFIFIGSLKGADRAKEKVEADYNGDWSQLRDMVRATISVPSMSGVKDAITHLKSAGIELAQKPKDRFAKPTAEGYRDLMTVVKLPNGMLAEIQIHIKSMTLAKTKGHKDYETSRSLQGKYNEAEPSEKWSDEDHEKFYDALKAQKKIYADAWGDAASSKESATKHLTKSDTGRRMILLVKGVDRGLHRE